MSNKKYPHEYELDEYEQEIEDNFESRVNIPNMEARIAELKKAAAAHLKDKKPITLRVNAMDLEIMRIKSSKLGIPYQTYINMLIHKDAAAGI